MDTIEALTIAGHDGLPLPNTFLRGEDETKHIALLFPGLGYTAAMPLLFYAGDVLSEMGADLLSVEYDYSAKMEGWTTADLTEAVMADATAACDAVLARREYERITLIGKSLGTVAMAHLISSNNGLRSAECIWLTPLLKNERLREAIRRTAPRSLFVIGTADHHYEREHLDTVVSATGGRAVVIDGANHGMQIERDVLRSIDAVAGCIRGMKEFLTG